jgi:tetratricopeptide (TPR) repeat protein
LRKELHERAAEWFSEIDSLLYAEHLERAGSTLAANAYVEAARAQMQLFHFEQALRLAERGIAVANQKADTYNLLMLKGQCLREMGHSADSIAAYQKALEAPLSDVDKCRAWIGLAAGMRVTDNFDEAFTALSNAEDVARSSQLLLELSQIHYYRGNLYFPLGNLEGCMEQHGLALEIAKQARSPECEAHAMSGLGDAYYSRGKMVTSLKYFQQCIELCSNHGFGRILVENQYMVAWNRLYMSEVRGSLEDAEKAIESAVQAGHKRAELISRITAARTLYEMSDLDAAETQILRGLELTDHLGANRFKPFCKIYLAKIQLARNGPRKKPFDILQNALEISRSTGIGFLGPWVLSTLALVNDDEKAALAALDEGEKILKSGCVGHNYLDFYRNAMEVAWRYGDTELIERYASALEEYIADEPLPWAQYYIMWGRALAAHQRKPNKKTTQGLRSVKDEAERLELLASITTLDQALKNH